MEHKHFNFRLSMVLTFCFFFSYVFGGGYTGLGKPINVYDEHDNLAGFLVKAYTDNCGSDCSVEVLFLKFNANNEITVSKVSILSSNSLGFDILEKNKNVYVSSFIWSQGDTHFSCHKFQVRKIKYVNRQFELKDEFVTQKEYAFDLGDAQGRCDLFPGIEKILKDNGY